MRARGMLGLLTEAPWPATCRRFSGTAPGLPTGLYLFSSPHPASPLVEESLPNELLPLCGTHPSVYVRAVDPLPLHIS